MERRCGPAPKSGPLRTRALSGRRVRPGDDVQHDDEFGDFGEGGDEFADLAEEMTRRIEAAWRAATPVTPADLEE